MDLQKSTVERALRDWDRLRLVLAVHRSKTFSGAARDLGVDHTTVARRLVFFEEDLGLPLFERGSDGFTATSFGEQVLAAAERMEGELSGLLRRIDGSGDGVSGRVRMTTTPDLAARIFAPQLAVFLKNHPALQIDLITDNRSLDLSRREADLAIRFSRPEAQALVAKQIGQVAFYCYAAKSDNRTFDTQKFLCYDNGAFSTAPDRYLKSLIPDDAIILRSNAMHVLQSASAEGAGCALLPSYIGDNDSRLKRVSAPKPMTPLPLWLAYHEDLKRSPRLRAAVKFVEEVVKNSSLGLPV